MGRKLKTIQIDKQWYIHTMEHYIALRTKKSTIICNDMNEFHKQRMKEARHAGARVA